jgi:hypothetical protein
MEKKVMIKRSRVSAVTKVIFGFVAAAILLPHCGNDQESGKKRRTGGTPAGINPAGRTQLDNTTVSSPSWGTVELASRLDSGYRSVLPIENPNDLARIFLAASPYAKPTDIGASTMSPDPNYNMPCPSGGNCRVMITFWQNSAIQVGAKTSGEIDVNSIPNLYISLAFWDSFAVPNNVWERKPWAVAFKYNKDTAWIQGNQAVLQFDNYGKNDSGLDDGGIVWLSGQVQNGTYSGDVVFSNTFDYFFSPSGTGSDGKFGGAYGTLGKFSIPLKK